jgi:hypothetical protein
LKIFRENLTAGVKNPAHKLEKVKKGSREMLLKPFSAGEIWERLSRRRVMYVEQSWANAQIYR